MHRPCHPAGVDFLVPVMGYICRICHKFYHSNSGAQLSHCKSLAHFENLQVSRASCRGSQMPSKLTGTARGLLSSVRGLSPRRQRLGGQRESEPGWG